MKDEKILLINHSLYGKNGFFWSPPGGGVNFGESTSNALKREFKEETGLEVEVGQLLFMNEFISPPLHAIELFFEIRSFDGILAKGTDPEISKAGQIIEEVCFLSWDQIRKFGNEQLHGIFSKIDSLQDLFKLEKYISADNS